MTEYAPPSPSEPEYPSIAAYRVLLDYALMDVSTPVFVQRDGFCRNEVFSRSMTYEERDYIMQAVDEHPNVRPLWSSGGETWLKIVPDPEQPAAQRFTEIEANVESIIDEAIAQSHPTTLDVDPDRREISREEINELIEAQRLSDMDVADKALFQRFLNNNPRLRFLKTLGVYLVDRHMPEPPAPPTFLDTRRPLAERFDLLFDRQTKPLVVDWPWIASQLKAKTETLKDLMPHSAFADAYNEEYELWEIVPPGRSKARLEALRARAEAEAAILTEQGLIALTGREGLLAEEITKDYFLKLREEGFDLDSIAQFFTYLRYTPAICDVRSQYLARKDAKTRETLTRRVRGVVGNPNPGQIASINKPPKRGRRRKDLG